MATATRTRRAASGTIKVSVARLSEDIVEIRVKKGGTLKDALLALGFEEDQLKTTLEGVRVNGENKSLTSKLKQGDFITVSPRVQGGL
mgnify:CR=1 FL=1